MKNLLYFSLFFFLSGLWEIYAQEDPDVTNSTQLGIQLPGKVKVSVLGVFHFADPGLYTYKPKFQFNILEEDRQKELEDLLERLKTFNPTKIILECNRVEFDSLLNERYRQFRSGEIKIQNKHSEMYQIGFKLAKMLGHEKIFCSDATAEWFGADLDWENFDHAGYLKSLGQYDKVQRYDYFKDYEKNDSLKTVQTLREHLTLINRPSSLLKYHQVYLTNSVIEGAGDNYVGADGVARWYRRNIRIFSNIYDLTEIKKEERVLVIYGVGHAWLLRQFLIDSPDYEYIDVTSILRAED